MSETAFLSSPMPVPGSEPATAGVGAHRNVTLLAALLLVLASPAPVLGAEAKSKDEAGKPATTEGRQSNDRSDSAARAAGGQSSDEDEGDFTPSEEISEDFAVSFPVDI